MATIDFTLTLFNGEVTLVLGRGFEREVYLTEGDTEPDLQITLKDQDGDPVDLTEATVTFSMAKLSTGELKITDAACSVTDGPNGVFTYSWGATDLDERGVFVGQFKVTTTGGTQRVFERLKLVVRAKLA